MSSGNPLETQLEGLFEGISDPNLKPPPPPDNEALFSSQDFTLTEGADQPQPAAKASLIIARLIESVLAHPKIYRPVAALVTFVVLTLVGMLVGWSVSPSPVSEAAQVSAMALPSSTPETPTPSPPPPLPSDTPSPTAAPTTIPRSTRTPTPSPTPTPTATNTPTPPPPPTMIAVSPFPTAEITPTPSENEPLPIPTPVSPVPMTSDSINILVLGSDRREDWDDWRTDAIHVVSIQADRSTVSVLSIPRDLYLYIPTFWMSRINFADYYGETYNYPGGGSQLVRDTLLYNLGIQIDYVVRTDFDGLIAIVDTLGGIDIPVHCYLEDHWPYADESGEYPILTMEPGIHHMDGETALWYARSRITTSVFSRERRQQQVLQAIWHRARSSLGISQVPALWEQFNSMISTDLQLADIVNLAQMALNLQDASVRFYNIGPDIVIPWTTPQGGWVFLPNWELIEPVIAEMMSPFPEARLSRTFSPVEVWNRTAAEQADLLAADLLARAGFAPVVGPTDWRVYPESQLVVFSEYGKGTGVGYLQEMFHIPDSRVTYEPEGSSEFGFRLILGADYRTCPW